MFLLRFPAVVLIGALTACTTSHVLRFDTKTHVGLLDFTGVHELEVDCPTAVDNLQAVFSHSCRAGKWRLQVLAPSGEVVVTSSAGPGTGDGEYHAKGDAGKWRCRIEMTGFTGDYSARLEAAGNWPKLVVMTRAVDVREGPAATEPRK